MKFLKLLIIPILFFTCSKEICHHPPCVPPNINAMAGLRMAFDTVSLDNSFLIDELSEVFFTTKKITTGDIISIDTITNLVETNYQITIGAEGKYLFGNSAQFVEYFYEIEIPTTDNIYVLNQLKFRPNDEECSCPDYVFGGVEINDSLVNLITETLILKK